MKKKRKKIVTWVIIIILILSISFIGYKFINNKNNQTADDTTTLTKRTSVVSIGDVSQTLSASGPLRASETLIYKAPAQGELATLNVNDGDYVNENDILATLDTSNLDETLENYESQIETMYENIDSANNDILDFQENITDLYEDIADKQSSITEIQVDIQEQVDSKSDLTIYSPISGVVFNIMVEEEDVLHNGSVLATISNVNIYEVELAINSKILEDEIQTVCVYYKNTKYDGTIVSTADFTYKDQFGNQLVDVILQFNMDSGLPQGDKVDATITANNITYYSYNEAIPHYAISERVIASVQGEVTSLFLTEKKAVNEGDILALLDPSYIDNNIESLNDQIDSINDQIDSLNNQITSFNDQIKNKNNIIEDYEETIADIEQSISELQEDYNNLQVKAQFNGVISNITVSVGDDLTPNSNLFTLTSMDLPKVTISIDELDITTVAIGMESSVVIDALTFTSKTPVNAEVTDIALVGTNQGGVTTYDVTITLTDEVEGLMLSMNSTATIFINISEDTLYVPIEAITMMGGLKYVYVETSGTESPIVNTEVKPDMPATGGGKGRSLDTSKMTAEQLEAYKEKMASAGITESDIAQKEAATNSIQDYYIGTALIEVTTGVYNESYIEILSGLEKGQIVVLPPTYTTDITTDKSPTGLFGDSSAKMPGMGGMGGK